MAKGKTGRRSEQWWEGYMRLKAEVTVRKFKSIIQTESGGELGERVSSVQHYRLFESDCN